MILKNKIKRILKSQKSQAIFGKIIHLYLRFVKLTSRFEISYDEGYSKEQFKSCYNSIFAFWHQQIGYAVMVLDEISHKSSAVISEHSDGRIIAEVVKNIGTSVISGSSNHGAVKAVKAILKTLREGSNVIITPDGPKGPAQKVGGNIMAIAAKTSSFIVPIIFRSSNYIEFNSWDKFQLPLPFSTIKVKFCHPISPANMEHENLLLEQSLNIEENAHKRGAKFPAIYKIFLYISSIVIFPLQLALITYRLFQKKEIVSRVLERLAISSDIQHNDMVWIHAASVGESMIGFTLSQILIEQLGKTKILLTTGTITSANNAEKKIRELSNKYPSAVIIHQFLPADNIFIARKFLNYWQPSLAIFLESELWPNILYETQKTCPIILANARMSFRSFSKWNNLRFISNNIAKCFSLVIAQSKRDFELFKALSYNNLKLSGNLKYVNNHKDEDGPLFLKLKSQIQKRDIFFAASTHKGDEEIAVDVFIELQKKYPDLLFILAPRHPHRLEEIANILQEKNINFVKRSDDPDITQNTACYILNSIGEMTAIYKLRPITFMGGSFYNGGHNILEPALHQSPIIFGPNMVNFQEIASEFLLNEAATQVNNREEMVSKVDGFLQSTPKKMISNASKIIIEKQKTQDEYITLIKPWIH